MDGVRVHRQALYATLGPMKAWTRLILGTTMTALSLLACGGDSGGGEGGSGAGTATGTGGSGAVGGGSSAGGGTTTGPDPQFLPAPTGACPAFTSGTNTFLPAGLPPRDVEIWIGDDPTAQDGPVVFYWHGTGSSPVLEPPYGLEGVIEMVTAMGGIVAAPHSDPNSGTWPWYLTDSVGPEDDMVVADEVLACAIENVGVDTTRIHSIGMSAGGLQTAQMSYRRSGYLASVVTYSGGLIGAAPEMPDPNNALGAMILHGGMDDVVSVAQFQTLSETYRDDFRAKGHFAFICDHGMGHTIPKMDGIQEAIGQFFMDHPYGTEPSPYADALPGSFPSWCGLQL